MVSSWRHVILPVPEWETHANPIMTQHIRERSRNPPHPKVWNGAGALASPPPMLKHKTVVYFPFPHQWCSIVSERPSSKNCITQGPVHRFATLISLLVPTGSHSRTYFRIEIMTTSQRHPNIRKPLCVLTIPKSKTNLVLKMTMTPKNLHKPGLDGPFENNFQHEKPQDVQTGPPACIARQVRLRDVKKIP